jgi:hypothetical protein
MPWDLLRITVDPTAPLPASWPVGALGVFLVFYLPVAAGIPLGVLLATRAGLSFVEIGALYFASDVAAAISCEPLLVLVRRWSRRQPRLAQVAARLSRQAADAGVRAGGVRGAFGVTLLGFTFVPVAARVAGAVAGYNMIAAWALGILGDMGYFVFAAACTLWLSSVFGNDARVTLLAVFLVTLFLPGLVGRFRRRPAATPLLTRAHVAKDPPIARAAARPDS